MVSILIVSSFMFGSMLLLGLIGLAAEQFIEIHKHWKNEKQGRRNREWSKGPKSM